MKFDHMHHVAIIVSDYEKTKEFYVEKLGLPILRDNPRPDKGDRKLDLQFGDGELEIFVVPDAAARPDSPQTLGIPHLAFRVDNIQEAAADLAAKGIACDPIRMDPYSQKPYMFFHDPDGLPLELHE